MVRDMADLLSFHEANGLDGPACPRAIVDIKDDEIEFRRAFARDFETTRLLVDQGANDRCGLVPDDSVFHAAITGIG